MSLSHYFQSLLESAAISTALSEADIVDDAVVNVLGPRTPEEIATLIFSPEIQVSTSNRTPLESLLGVGKPQPSDYQPELRRAISQEVFRNTSQISQVAMWDILTVFSTYFRVNNQGVDFTNEMHSLSECLNSCKDIAPIDDFI